MGNETSRDTAMMKDYNPVSSNSIESLGTMTLFKNSGNGDLKMNLMTTYNIQNKSLAESELQQMMKLNNNPHICKLVKYNISKNQQLCLETYSLDLVFEAYPTTLHSIINGRNYNFKDEEIWSIAEQLLTYLGHLKAIGLTDGDLQPKNIYFAPNMPLKVFNFLLFTQYQNAYRMRASYRPYTSALAPELLFQMKNGNMSPDYDPYKADVFSYGIILLSAATMTPYESFYNFNENTILFDQIKAKLVMVADRRKASDLFEFIDSCLKQNVAERASLEELFKKVPGRMGTGQSIGNWRY